MGHRVAPRNSPFNGPVDTLVNAVQLPRAGGYNPYVDILRGSLCAAGFVFGGVHFFGQTPRIVLLHWTENFWFDGASSTWARSRRFAIRRALPLLLRTLRARGFKVVWFAHNQTPHDWTESTDAWFQRANALYEQVDAVVHLTNASSRLPAFDRFQALPQTVVRHPHYDLVDPAVHSGQAGEIRRLLMLGGASQPRKNARSAVQATRNIPDITAVITGDLASDFATGFASQPNLEMIDGILSEPSLFALFDGSTAVLLNQPNQLNSGCMFLGLSRGAPVICPDTPANREIRSLVGSGWIRLFEHPLSSEKLAELIREPVPVNLPDLAPFNPEVLGRSFRQWVDQQLILSDSGGRGLGT